MIKNKYVGAVLFIVLSCDPVSQLFGVDSRTHIGVIVQLVVHLHLDSNVFLACLSPKGSSALRLFLERTVDFQWIVVRLLYTLTTGFLLAVASGFPLQA